MPEIKQLFFDCDNTLVFSEEVAFEACAGLTNAVLAEHGISQRYTSEELIMDFLGLSFRGIMDALQKKYKFEIPASQISYYVKQEEDAVIAQIQEKGRPCTGSVAVLEKLVEGKKYNLAVASSSALRRIRASLDKSGQAKFFPHEHVYSAVTSLEKPSTKPSPAVYLFAMEKLGVKPEECVTVEDSKSGALAAVRAKIPCIAYVGAYSTKKKQEQVAQTLVELGCKAVMYNWSEYLNILNKIEQS